MNAPTQPPVPSTLAINGDEFTRVTTKTTPKQFVETKYDNDAFAGNDNNRRLVGERIVEAAKQTGKTIDEVARNNAPEGSVVHKSNLAAAQAFLRSTGQTATAPVPAKPEGGEAVTQAPASDPAITGAKGTPPATGAPLVPVSSVAGDATQQGGTQQGAPGWKANV